MMNRYLSLLPAALASALLLVGATSGGRAHADAVPQVDPALLRAAVAQAEAERRAALPAKAKPTAAAGELDRMAGAAEKIDPARIDPEVAANAIAN